MLSYLMRTILFNNTNYFTIFEQNFPVRTVSTDYVLVRYNNSAFSSYTIRLVHRTAAPITNKPYPFLFCIF